MCLRHSFANRHPSPLCFVLDQRRGFMHTCSMSFWEHIGLFAAQTFLVSFFLIFFIFVLAMIVASARGKSSETHLETEMLNPKWDEFENSLKHILLGKKSWKVFLKSKKKSKDKIGQDKPTIFVLDFEGDIKASQTEELREEITAVLQAVSPSDEVFVKVESPGGMVPHYGFAASQLDRFRVHKVKLTISVDRIAASGGYMMACVANQIVAAPFAIIGSIGVVAQLPNFSKVLKKYDVDFKEYTAGEYKRTVGPFTPITEKAEEKLLEQLGDTHRLFKNFINVYRPQVNIGEVATGEYWLAQQALGLKLVDEIGTSDEWLYQRRKTHQILNVNLKRKITLSKKVGKLWNQLLTQFLY